MIGLLPFLIAAAVGIAVLLAFSIEKVISGILEDKIINWKYSVWIIFGLFAIWFFICIIILLSAGLSHSARIIDIVPARCFFLFLIIVGLHGTSLSLLHYRRVKKEANESKMKIISIIAFSVIIFFIFYFVARSNIW